MHLVRESLGIQFTNLCMNPVNPLIAGSSVGFCLLVNRVEVIFCCNLRCNALTAALLRHWRAIALIAAKITLKI